MSEFALHLPESNNIGTHILACRQTVVIIGANGAGKTRMGAWIEMHEQYGHRVHRISAQKSLSMPESIQTSSFDLAQDRLLYGRHISEADRRYQIITRKDSRWQNKPATYLQNDFDALMSLLFSEEATVSIHHRQAQKNASSLLPVPETRLDIIKSIWEFVLPQRQLLVGGQKIETRIANSESLAYNGAEMSDGERVIFYLIGQALSAPKDGIIVIDEPELHLHRSIQTRLRKAIQAKRPDCLFVYITHDLEFAASVRDATKIWLKQFDGTRWQWELVPNLEGLPEPLLLQVLGSRVPVVFVEGTHGSYDASLFQSIYNNFTVIPRGSCSQVIQSTQAIRLATDFHHVQAYGIVDQDRLHREQIIRLNNEGIQVIDVAEVENLFCVPEVLTLVAQHQGMEVENKVEEAKQYVFRELRRDIETQISLRVANEIKFRLNVFDIKKQGAIALKSELANCVSGIDVEQIYNEVSQEFNDVLQNADYAGALRLFNRKGLANQLSGIFEIKSLPAFVLRMVQGQNSEEWIHAFVNYAPKLT